MHNISSIQNNGVSPVVKIVFNPNENSNQNIMSVCYNDGIVELFKLSDSFAHIGMNEIENLSKNWGQNHFKYCNYYIKIFYYFRGTL